MLIQAIVAATSIIVSSTSMILTIQSKVHFCDFILFNEICTSYFSIYDIKKIDDTEFENTSNLINRDV